MTDVLQVVDRLFDLPVWGLIVIVALGLVWKALTVIEKFSRRDP